MTSNLKCNTPRNSPNPKPEARGPGGTLEYPHGPKLEKIKLFQKAFHTVASMHCALDLFVLFASSRDQRYSLRGFVKNLSKIVIKVKTLWKGHKIWKNIPPFLTKQLFLLSSVKTSGRFFQILWPFQKSWTLHYIELKWIKWNEDFTKFCGFLRKPELYWSNNIVYVIVCMY